MLAWVAKNHEEAAAARPLRYSTTQLVYQGAGMPEELSQLGSFVFGLAAP